jgi:hypothetical protein
VGFKIKLGSIGKALGSVAKVALPIAGGLLGGWAGGALFGTAGKIAGGILGSMLGGALSGGGGDFRLQDSYSYQTFIPPYAQQGASILQQLLGQSSQYAQTIANIKRPYLEQAKSSFESLQSEIPALFDKTKSEVSGLYDALLSQTQDLITSEQAKQNLKLGALGLLNTQAQQWTTADILKKTAFPILEDKTEALAKLSEAETDALLKYLLMKPDFYANYAEEMASTDPYLLEQQYKMQMASALMGVPVMVQPTVKRGLLNYPAVFELGKDLLSYLIK